MNLIIDIGNTRTKLSLIDNNKIIEFKIIQTKQEIVSLFPSYKNISAAIISSVQTEPIEWQRELEELNIPFIIFDHRTKTPLENLYKSKETLGYDRLAACIGANQLYRNTHILVIDAGTAITFDFVNSKNQYLGGTISPGLSMRFKALNHYTKKLPLLKQDNTFSLIGDSTQSAIVSGVQNGLIFEIDGYISEIKKKNPNFIIILTGGDANFLETKVKNKTIVETNIIQLGLNTILEHNDL